MKLSDVIANEVDPYVICAKEAPHVILHPNQAWLEMCGYALEEVEGLTNKILTGPETSDEVIDDLLRQPPLPTPAHFYQMIYIKPHSKSHTFAFFPHVTADFFPIS